MEDKKKKLLIAQELHFAKTLAGNDKTKRDRALKKLHKWLHARTHDGSCGFSKEDYLRIWKGIFYCMWMSDKPLIQEEVAEKISHLIHSIGEGGELFIKCFLLTMIHEWNGIDQYRLDKFQMLVRRFLRQSFEWARKSGWSTGGPALCSVFQDTILKPSGTQEGVPIGLLLHFSDVYAEELTKAVDEKLQPPESDVVIQMLRPFARLLLRNDDPRIVGAITETVFNHLMRQSDVGLDYEELRSKGWHRTSEIGSDDDGKGGEGAEDDDDDDEEEDSGGQDTVEGSDEEGDENVLSVKDPRAGGVNVVLPQLDVDFVDLSSMLNEEAREPSIRPKRKRSVEDLAQRLLSITEGKYPLEVGTIPSKLRLKRREVKNDIKRAARELIKLDDELLEKDLDVADEDEAPVKKKKKIMNGKLPEEDEAPKGRKRKRGKRKSKAERWMAAKRKLEENSTDVGIMESLAKKKDVPDSKVVNSSVKQESRGKQVNGKVRTAKQGMHSTKTDTVEEEVVVPSPNKRRRSVGEGWEVCELKSPLRFTRLRSSVGGGSWVVETSGGKGAKVALGKRTKPNGDLVTTPKGVEDKEECDTEVVVRKLRPNPFSPLGRKLVTPQSAKKVALGSASKSKTPSSDKKVKIVLSRNLSQGTQEYQKSLKASPAIPYDPTKVPAQGVLKATSSPILLNPFYRKSLRNMKLSP